MLSTVPATGLVLFLQWSPRTGAGSSQGGWGLNSWCCFNFSAHPHQSCSLSSTTSCGWLSPNTVTRSCYCSLIFWVPKLAQCGSFPGHQQIVGLLWLSLPVKAKYFIFEIYLSQWSCCDWTGQGHQTLGLFLLPSLPQLKPLPPSTASGGSLPCRLGVLRTLGCDFSYPPGSSVSKLTCLQAVCNTHLLWQQVWSVI
jgi:hypothetical protein